MYGHGQGGAARAARTRMAEVYKWLDSDDGPGPVARLPASAPNGWVRGAGERSGTSDGPSQGRRRRRRREPGRAETGRNPRCAVEPFKFVRYGGVPRRMVVPELIAPQRFGRAHRNDSGAPSATIRAGPPQRFGRAHRNDSGAPSTTIRATPRGGTQDSRLPAALPELNSPSRNPLVRQSAPGSDSHGIELVRCRNGSGTPWKGLVPGPDFRGNRSHRFST